MPFFFFVNYSPEDCFSFLVCSFLFFSFSSVCVFVAWDLREVWGSENGIKKRELCIFSRGLIWVFFGLEISLCI